MAMSATFSSGLVGVSSQTTLVLPGRIAALGERRERAAVRVVGEAHVATRHAERADQGVLGGQAAGEGEPSGAGFDRGQTPLERGRGRIGRPGVLVAVAKPADAVLFVGT